MTYRLSIPNGQAKTCAVVHFFRETQKLGEDQGLVLLRELAEYYMLAERVNGEIKAFTDSQVQPGGAVFVEYAKKLKIMSDFHDQNVEKLKAKNVIALKNKIAKEMFQLSETRKKLENSQ